MAFHASHTLSFPWPALGAGSECEVAENPGAFDRSLQHHLVEVLLLRMVFMSEGKQSRLSPAQKADVWSRWKAGSRCMRLGVPTASPITAFAVCCCRAEGLLQPLAGALA